MVIAAACCQRITLAPEAIVLAVTASNDLGQTFGCHKSWGNLAEYCNHFYPDQKKSTSFGGPAWGLIGNCNWHKGNGAVIGMNTILHLHEVPL